MMMLAGEGMAKGTDTLFEPEVVGGLIDGVEVWRKVGARRADGHRGGSVQAADDDLDDLDDPPFSRLTVSLWP